MTATRHRTLYGWWLLAGAAYLRRFDSEAEARGFAAANGLEVAA
jgi:hypothetical protein